MLIVAKILLWVVLVHSGELGFYSHYAGADKPHLLFVHGTPGNKEAFKAYYENERLKKNFNMLSVNRLGFGDSQFKKSSSFKEHAEHIIGLLKKEQPKKDWVCIGHSYGASLCLYMLKNNPEVFKTGLLIAGAYDSKRRVLKWYNHLAKLSLIKWVLPKSLSVSNEEMWSMKAEMKEAFSDFEGVKQEIHFVHGAKDKIVPVGDSDQMHLRLKMKNPKSQYFRVKDQGHFILWKKKDWLVEKILDLFLKSS